MKFKEIDIHLVRYVSINFSSLKNLQRILTSPSLNHYIKNFKSQLSISKRKISNYNFYDIIYQITLLVLFNSPFFLFNRNNDI